MNGELYTRKGIEEHRKYGEMAEIAPNNGPLLTSLTNSPEVPLIGPYPVVPIDSLFLYYGFDAATRPIEPSALLWQLVQSLNITQRKKGNVTSLDLTQLFPGHLAVNHCELAVHADEGTVRQVVIRLTAPRYKNENNLQPLTMFQFQHLMAELDDLFDSYLPGLKVRSFLISRIDLFINIKKRFSDSTYDDLRQGLRKLYYTRHNAIKTTDYFYANRLKSKKAENRKIHDPFPFEQQHEYITVYDKTLQLSDAGSLVADDTGYLRFELRLRQRLVLEKILLSTKVADLLDNLDRLRSVLSDYLLSSLLRIAPADLNPFDQPSDPSSLIEHIIDLQDGRRTRQARVAKVKGYYRIYGLRDKTGQCIVPLAQQNTHQGERLHQYREWCFRFHGIESANPKDFATAYRDLVNQVKEFSVGSPKINDLYEPRPAQAENTETKFTLSHVRARLLEEYLKIILDPHEGTFILKIPPGVGKTKATLNMILGGTIREAMIAIPRKELHSEEYDSVGILYPDLPYFLERAAEPAQYAQTDPSDLLAEARRNASPEQLSEISAYEDQLRRFRASKIQFVTHERLLRNPNIATGTSLLIIDEDPLSSILHIVESDSARINKLSTRLRRVTEVRHGEAVKRIFRRFTGATRRLNKVFGNPVTRIQTRYRLENALKDMVSQRALRLAKSRETKNIGALVEADFLLEEAARGRNTLKTNLYGIKVRQLPHPRKTIILSGTIDGSLYQKYIIPHRAPRVIEFGNIQHDSTLIQYYDYSFPRNLKPERYSDLIAAARYAKAKGSLLCTHKKYVHILKAHGIKVDFHFGGLSGLNKFAGQNIVFIGTPFIRVSDLKLWAAALGLDPDGIHGYDTHSDSLDKFVEYGGVKFRYPKLSRTQAILFLQLLYTSGELMQAIGRARYLEYKVTIEVFSTFALPGFIYRARPDSLKHYGARK